MNKVILVGGLGRDPELRYTQSGVAVSNFSLATERYNSKTKERETVWHNVTLWGKPAETLSKYTQKGSRIALEGELIYEKYTTKEGVEKDRTIIQCYNSPEIISGFKKSDDGASMNVDDVIDDVPF